MLNHILKSRPAPQGSTIERIWTYELTTAIAFRGRRRPVYRRVVALSGARPGDRILDIGCNGGYLARLLAAAVTPGGHVTGVDPSPPAIAHATRRAPANAAFAVGAAQDLRWPDGEFDVVTSTLAVHHIPEPDRAAAFGEMFRVTPPRRPPADRRLPPVALAPRPPRHEARPRHRPGRPGRSGRLPGRGLRRPAPAALHSGGAIMTPCYGEQ